jgi:lipopolysaccharide transport system ATP-binding protein
MENPIIEVRNLGKKYNINHQQGKYIALRDVLAGIFKNPLKFIRDKTKEVAGINTKEDYWALKDLNFTVNKGEVIGIIGRNGAGKSTLLKILSQITPPTTGEIKIRGRVGSLLEVGTGFHPELTGRENIRLNGAILGMTYKEIAKKFDQIVEFAGIEKFLDTPVKYYSSGMYVRLAFSVAAHMEPDILIIDEVLAVGDAEFQKKCLGKMGEITKQDGRTILFVSHNMAAIRQLCTKTILLENGKLLFSGNTEEVIQHYNSEMIDKTGQSWNGDAGDDEIRITRVLSQSLDQEGKFHTNAPIEISIHGTILKMTKHMVIGFHLFSQFGYELAYSLYDDNDADMAPTVLKPGPFIKKFVIPADTLSEGTYLIELDVGIHNLNKVLRPDQGRVSFSLSNVNGIGKRFSVPQKQGYVSVFRPRWSQQNN